VKESDPISEEVFVALPQVVVRRKIKGSKMPDTYTPMVLNVMRFMVILLIVYTISITYEYYAKLLALPSPRCGEDKTCPEQWRRGKRQDCINVKCI
jgi:hypothetical protein